MALTTACSPSKVGKSAGSSDYVDNNPTPTMVSKYLSA
jgi:hypothetical protein